VLGNHAGSKRTFTVAALAGAVAGCSLLTGASDFLVTDGCMDCPDASTSGDGSAAPPAPSDGGIQSRDAAHEGPPACDGTKDPSCLALPGGWRLVAVTELNGKVPDCPDGFDGSKEGKLDVGEGPSARSDTCACDSCTVTKHVACGNPVFFGYGPGCKEVGGETFYTNYPPGTCQTIPSTIGPYPDPMAFTVFPATGGGSGACTPSPPSFHDNRVDWARRMRLCSEIARCSGGVCDARLDPPFRACVAQDGEHSCPDGFPERMVVAEKAAFDCSGSCGCRVMPGCSATLAHYSDSNCTAGEVAVTADGMCRATPLAGKVFRSYKVTSIPATKCTGTGTATASNGRLDSPITVCCR